MARSLTVSHEESPGANWLLIGFVLLAIVFLSIGSIVTMASADEAEATVVSDPLPL